MNFAIIIKFIGSKFSLSIRSQYLNIATTLSFNKNFEFFKLVKRQSGCNIKILRFDRGEEFTSNEFYNY